MRPNLAVFIPIWNEPEKLLKQNIKVFNNIDYSSYIEIYWLIHESDNKTLEKIKKLNLGNIKVLIDNEKRPLKALAINNAFKKVNPEAFAVFDVDVIIEKDFLTEGYKKLINEDLDAIQGERRIYNFRKNIITKFRTLDFEVADSLYKKGFCILHGNGLMIKGETFKKLGMFSRNIVEDLEFSFKLYKKKKSVEFFNKKYWEEAPEGFWNFVRQDIRWTSGSIYLGRSYKFPNGSPLYKVYSNRQRFYYLLNSLTWWLILLASFYFLFIPFLLVKMIAIIYIIWTISLVISGNRCYIRYLAHLQKYPIKPTPKLIAFYFFRDKIIYPVIVFISFFKAYLNPYGWYHTHHIGIDLKGFFKNILGLRRKR